MAYDDRNSSGRFSDRGRGRWRGEHDRDDGPETQWRGDPWFGGGWGNQLPQAQRLGDRHWREADDPWAGHHGAAEGDLRFGGPGYDGSFGGPRRLDLHGSGARATRASSAFEGAFGAGAGFRAGWDGDDAITRNDPHYSQWRERQIAQLDRDYEDYRSEQQSHFDREFGAWRERRGVQREAVARVAPDMEVVGSDGAHVGTVDATRGDDIVLTRSDPSAGGIHHRIPCGWVDRVEDKVVLNLTAEEATARWREDSRSRALFERPDSGSTGPHILNRSFAGTYRDKR